jgi:hypothetical protein
MQLSEVYKTYMFHQPEVPIFVQSLCSISKAFTFDLLSEVSSMNTPLRLYSAKVKDDCLLHKLHVSILGREGFTRFLCIVRKPEHAVTFDMTRK